MIARLALAAVSACAQTEGLPPLEDAGLPPLRLEERREPTGFWPVDALYGLAVDTAGRKRVDGWTERGLKSLERNLYRKYYIEGGLFLLQLPAPGSPPGDDHFVYIPKDPSADPRVIFMKDIHKLAEASGGTH